MYRGTFSIIDLRALSHNLQVLKRRLAPDTRLLIAVKANAYGHGLEPVMNVVMQGPVAQVAVATLEEALAIRKAGYDIPILLFGALGPLELTIAARHQVEVSYIPTWDDYSILPQFDPPLKVHIPLDTGMNRIGFKSIESTKAFLDWVRSRSDVIWSGVYTHLACADASSDEHAQAQIRQFRAWLRELEQDGYQVPLAHAANSAGAWRDPAWHFDMVRVGISAYGYSPDDDVLAMPELRPVMHVYSSISRIETVNSGETISYGATYRADRRMRVATVQMGYADGYPRVLSNQGTMLVRGQKALVVGRVCMDQLMLDVSHIEDVQVGDFVTVFGADTPAALTPQAWGQTAAEQRERWLVDIFSQQQIGTQQLLPLNHLATLAGTISYELLCQISARVPKLYVQ
jgi:alanine racemase